MKLRNCLQKILKQQKGPNYYAFCFCDLYEVINLTYWPGHFCHDERLSCLQSSGAHCLDLKLKAMPLLPQISFPIF